MVSVFSLICILMAIPKASTIIGMQLSSKIHVVVSLFAFFYFPFVVYWNGLIHQMTRFFLLLTLGLVLWLGFGDPFVFQSPREFYISFSWTSSGLCIYHLTVCPNFSLSYNGSTSPLSYG